MATFTFHNVSIKTMPAQHRSHLSGPFTFHNVSIKTLMSSAISVAISYLHSTMFLLKQLLNIEVEVEIHNLHSTMFLLKRDIITITDKSGNDLHSTMFLLKLPHGQSIPFLFSAFTFHNVSIKTLKDSPSIATFVYLHSTMFLLKQQAKPKKNWKNSYLHSTMFLLKRKHLGHAPGQPAIFTFHNVSIKTVRRRK